VVAKLDPFRKNPEAQTIGPWIIANRAKAEKRESGLQGNARCEAGGWGSRVEGEDNIEDVIYVD
jgi:hypothetical protein